MSAKILITARLKSTRLPMKALKEIKGRPMICHLIDRLKLSTHADGIVLCTSTVAQDDPLVDIAADESIDCYRGHPDDVLLRLTRAAEQFKAQTVISCTADNPFVDPEYIDQLIRYHTGNQYDFTHISGLPFGTFSYALSYPAMKKACEIKDEIDTEVWGGYFTQTGLFKCGTLEVTDDTVRRPDLRLTVDTPEDFELISKVFEVLYVEDRIFSLPQIVKLCDENPELTLINRNVQQKPGKPIRVNVKT
ncbi:MAG: 3-deoxy-manno-octulosonate cytidylyltransferase [Desulfobacteraceae bacterium]|nr:MAG: 3-deoxy-manno-octulosonate cytidylyltransferase [Desulfobacteraceae bacterium]